MGLVLLRNNIFWSSENKEMIYKLLKFNIKK